MTTNVKSGRLWPLALVGGGFCALFALLWRVPNASAMLLEYKSLLLTAYSIFIAGPLWIAYNRLNGLDALEGLRPVQAKIVSDFSVHAKGILLRYFVSCVCILVFAIVLGVASNAFAHFKLVVTGIAIATIIVFFVLAVIRVIETLFRVEKTIRSVNNWKSEQKERNREAMELIKARKEKQLDLDSHLLGFREFIIAGDNRNDVPKKHNEKREGGEADRG